jgi:hypothetical protein
MPELDGQMSCQIMESCVQLKSSNLDNFDGIHKYLNSSHDFRITPTLG